MTKKKCPPDCTCYDCLERMADPSCADCRGDGYWIENDSDVLCSCTEAARVEGSLKAEKRANNKPEKTGETK